MKKNKENSVLATLLIMLNLRVEIMNTLAESFNMESDSMVTDINSLKSELIKEKPEVESILQIFKKLYEENKTLVQVKDEETIMLRKCIVDIIKIVSEILPLCLQPA